MIREPSEFDQSVIREKVEVIANHQSVIRERREDNHWNAKAVVSKPVLFLTSTVKPSEATGLF